MKPTDFVQLTLLALGGSISGKTNLQKKVYFLGILTGQLDKLGYRPHYYGPYSETVATAVEDLKTVGALDQNVTSAFGVDEMGFERRRYDYSLTLDGRRLAEAKKAKFCDVWDSLKIAVTKLRAAGDRDYMKLSIAAKTHFMLRKHEAPLADDELAQLAPRFGWRVTADEVKEAAAYLAKLNLVTRQLS